MADILFCRGRVCALAAEGLKLTIQCSEESVGGGKSTTGGLCWNHRRVAGSRAGIHPARVHFSILTSGRPFPRETGTKECGAGVIV